MLTYVPTRVQEQVRAHVRAYALALMLPGGLEVTARKPCPQLVAAMPVLPGYRMLYDEASDAGNSQISLLALRCPVPQCGAAVKSLQQLKSGMHNSSWVQADSMRAALAM